MIKEYQIVSAFYPDDLAKKVNEKIDEGWLVYGYPSVIVLNDKFKDDKGLNERVEIDRERFYQAMVKYNEDEVDKTVGSEE